MSVTARWKDGTAAVYNTVEEALDQAAYDEVCGFRELEDIIEGAHPADSEAADHTDRAIKAATNKAPTKAAGRKELRSHRAKWRKQWGVVSGVMMPVAEATSILKAEAKAAKDAAAELERKMAAEE